MKFRFWLLSVACLFIIGRAAAYSDSLLLTKNFKFQDGIYLDFTDLQQNRPTYRWEEVSARMATSDEGFIAQVERIRKDQQLLDLSQVWGICIGGIPYIRLPEGEVTESATVFAGLRVRGKISYFKYKTIITEMKEVKAYNPLNGRAFRQGIVPVERTVEREQMLHWEDGTIVDFTVANFLDWIQDDRQLWRAVRDLSPEDAEEKLFQCLLIYADRSKVYLKTGD
ncbi:MAG TPA: hypothetical protein PKC76_03565 [Saprospiraceae bacterium]|nr:hypothetical protein [Saprospiraceae bacterium]HMP23181.1 hypothetical protein [Saprospiraceae bacterium]